MLSKLLFFTPQNHDFKHIASQLEQQAGVKSEIDMICHLWTTREQAYNQLRHLEMMLQDLNLRDNDVTEGLKVIDLNVVFLYYVI